MQGKTGIWQAILLGFGGIVVAVALLVIILALFPQIIPNYDYSIRESANTSLDLQFYAHDGDMFWVLPNQVRPPDDNPLLAEYTIAWDENGFRQPSRLADEYPIAVFGDSFTEGANVARPYPDVLAEILDTPVKNYGYRGYGPYEIHEVIDSYLTQSPREWVLYAHFSGNDINEVLRPEGERIAQRNPFHLLPFALEQASDNLQGQIGQRIQLQDEAQYNYPMPIIIGGNYYELAFLDIYLWWQLLTESDFVQSTAYDAISQNLQSIDDELDDVTCRAVVFLPTKEQLYFEYIHPNARRYLREQPTLPTLHGGGVLTLDPTDPIPAENEAALIDSLANQRDAVRALATERNWQFIDLLDPMADAVARGDLLYYRYDTHWNQDGHQLAAEIIADAMRDANCRQ